MEPVRKKKKNKKAIAAVSLGLIVAIACLCMSQRIRLWMMPRKDFRHDLLLSYTPVKDQGMTTLCWAYAMLSTIETTHIMQGDSINLSPMFVGKHLARMIDAGKAPKDKGALPQTLIDMIYLKGICAHDAYRDTTYDPPRYVFMLGAEYTPKEFAHSVCGRDEYEALVNLPDKPYGKMVELNVPDNWRHHKQLNVPLDTLMARLDYALEHRQGVCWEGDTSEPGFMFLKGLAVLGDEPRKITEQERLREWQRGNTTDDHAMAIIGIAHDMDGNKYYIIKNSWGTDNAYSGLMYMSEEYLALKTLCLVLPRRND